MIKSTLIQPATCLGFVGVWDILEKSTAQITVSHLCRITTWRDLSRHVSWVKWGLRKTPVRGQMWKKEVKCVSQVHKSTNLMPTFSMQAGCEEPLLLNRVAMASSSPSVPRESSTDPYPFSPHPEVNQFGFSLYVPRNFELLPLSWNPKQVNLCKWIHVWSSQEESLRLWQLSISLRFNPRWFSQPDIMGTTLIYRNLIAHLHVVFNNGCSVS